MYRNLMRKLLFVASVTALLLFASADTSHATVIAFDNFDYANGDLPTVSGGTWVAVAGSPLPAEPVEVVNGEARVRMNGLREDDNFLSFSSTTGSIYYGIDFRVPSLAPGMDTSPFFAAFTNAFSTSANGRLTIVEPAGAGPDDDFTIGVTTDSTGVDATWSTDLTFNTTYRAVVRYDQVTNESQLWIDAVSDTDTSISGTDQLDANADIIERFELQQARTSFSPVHEVFVDNLVIGTTFNNVVTAVPEPSAAALLLLVGCGAGAVAMRSRWG